MTPVAWVAGTPLDVSEVDAREATLRSGPPATALPNPGTSEGRQLRRWLVQLLTAERVIAAEAAARGLTAATAPPLTDLAADPAALLELGSIPATLLSQNPLARAVFLAVTRPTAITPEQTTRYHAANPEQFHHPEHRLVRHAIMTEPHHDPELPNRPLRTLRPGELTGAVERAVFAAPAGAIVGPIRDPLGWHVLRVEAIEPERVRPLDEARPEIERRLLAHARRRAFTAWLDGRCAELVRLAPGYEHPGDPGQPDNTHRH
jgi:[acyl-carrier-protein] S-malonyltransferase